MHTGASSRIKAGCMPVEGLTRSVCLRMVLCMLSRPLLHLPLGSDVAYHSDRMRTEVLPGGVRHKARIQVQQQRPPHCHHAAALNISGERD